MNEILKLNNEIKTLEKEILTKKTDQKKFFKKRYANFRGLNKKYNIQYDLIQSALFGNNIVF